MYNDLISVFSFFKQKTAYEMRISDWSSDVCSSDLAVHEIWLAEFMGAELFRAVPDFFVDRLKVQQREAGVRHDLIDAVFGLEKRKDEIVGNLARVKALQAFMATDDGAKLLAGYKRAADILKQEGERSASRLRAGGGG